MLNYKVKTELNLKNSELLFLSFLIFLSLFAQILSEFFGIRSSGKIKFFQKKFKQNKQYLETENLFFRFARSSAGQEFHWLLLLELL